MRAKRRASANVRARRPNAAFHGPPNDVKLMLELRASDWTAKNGLKRRQDAKNGFCDYAEIKLSDLCNSCQLALFAVKRLNGAAAPGRWTLESTRH